MTQEDSDPNDVRDESITETTRRGALAALGLGGLAALGSGGASAQLGGGPESDPMSEYQVPTYRVPESDLDTPGVVGRRVEITAGGSTWSAGDQLVDTGSSWERISAGYDSVNTEKQNGTIEWVPSGSTAGEINDIISGVPSGWGIRFEAGSYPDIDQPITDAGQNDITLVGPGWGTELKAADGLNDNIFDIRGVVGWEITNFYTNGNRQNQTDDSDPQTHNGFLVKNIDNLHFHGNYVYNNLYNNVRVKGGDYAVIENNVCDTTEPSENLGNVPADNISIDDPMEGWRVHNNTCLNCGHQAIEISTDSEDGVVSENYVENPNAAGIQTHFATRVSVHDNIVVGGNSNHYFIGNPDSPVVGNISVNSAGTAFRVKADNTNRLAFVGNVAFSPSTHGFAILADCDGALIGFNTVNNAGGEGIKLGTTTGTGQFNTDAVGFNYISNCRRGIEILEGRKTEVGNNVVTECDTGLATDSNCLLVNFNNNSLSSNTTTVDDSGSRTKWNDTIGDGALGGVNISIITGGYDGDTARSNGNSGNANDVEGSLWIWDGPGNQWIRPLDSSQATISF